jgi:hypothetical protein
MPERESKELLNGVTGVSWSMKEMTKTNSVIAAQELKGRLQDVS